MSGPGSFTRASVIDGKLMPVASGQFTPVTVGIGPVEINGVGETPPQPQPPPVSVRPFPKGTYIGVFDDAIEVAPANTAPIGPRYPKNWVDLEYAETHDLTHEETWGHAARPRWIYAPPSHRGQLTANLLPGDEIWTPAYRQKGEALSTFRLRVAQDVIALELTYHQPIEIVAGACDFSVLSEAECLDCFPVYRDLYDLSPLICGVRFFAWDRRNGVSAHPSFVPWIDAFVAASPGIPINPPLPHPMPPPVHEVFPMKTPISDHILNCRFGKFSQGFEQRDTTHVGSDEQPEVVKNDDGSYSLKSPDGSEWLSIQPDGSRQARQTSDPSQPGVWEKFDRTGNVLTERPKNGISRPLVSFIVRDL